MKIKEIVLNPDDQLSLLYVHKGPLVLVCVSQKTDIYEMSQFLELVWTYI